MARFACELPLGAQLQKDGYTRFSIWAPDLDQVALEIEGREPLPMERDGQGVHRLTTRAEAGTGYRYRVSNDLAVPDPASRAQKDDVHGPSLVVNPQAYEWQKPGWRGRPWREMVIYEVHPGCYGGFAGLQAELPRLAELGITAIELMPIADFSGEHNWGYDGVLPYAPDRAYGSPDDLKRLVDRAHQLNLCVYLDVVYNHFGPDGNYLHAYASSFFAPESHSPWGAAIDFSQPLVRRFFTENALYWLMEYRFDGLRFDAVHAISDQDWLDEMAAELRRHCEPDRHVHLMLENERNTSSHLEKDYDAQWNDDIHNVIHRLLTGENEGYYANYLKEPTAQLARALAEGFVYQGEPAPAKGNRPRGTPSGHLPPHKFIFFLQNHDQVGNRAFGERLAALTDPSALRAAVTLQLMCPQIPLLFMGEEKGLETPFLFFTDFHGELAEAVRNGRRQEFKAFSHFSDPEIQATIPDPNAPETFEQSCKGLRAGATSEEQQQVENFYRRLLQLRAQYLVPDLETTRSLGAWVVAENCVTAAWRLNPERVLHLLVNLGPDAVAAERPPGRLLFESEPGVGAMAGEGRAAPRSTSVFIETSTQT